MYSISNRFLPAALAAAILIAVPAAAQQRDNQDKQLTCNDRDNSDRGSSCEIKEIPLSAMPALNVDAGMNGGIRVRGANRSDILVRAKIQASAETDAEARAIGSRVRVNTGGGKVHADGPDNLGRREWWSVSYEIFVPRQIDLELRTHNGGLRISDVKGRIGFEALNGGVSLDRLAGTVRGRTTNGGLKVELAGDRWDGDEMDVQTTNGGVNVSVPANYSARFEAATVNGGMKIDFPVTVQGDIKRNLSVTLGSGGAPIKVATTNGGVHIRRS